MIDLRSDTVTKPTPAMRQAIANAEVGDDVIDRDPTVEALQELTASILGKEAAIFMPSGSMTNQIAIRIHCKPGDEFLCEANCHVYNYEQAAFAQLSGVVARTIEGASGVLEPSQLEGMIRPDNEHFVRTRLVTIENTHNRGGGTIQPFDKSQQIAGWAKSNGIRAHLDGARLWNAVVATGISADRWSHDFDTVSVCFSKGLGAPVGSALAGPKDMIKEARRHRKAFGGGMRQAGILAAGALFALKHHRERLSDDNVHAKILANRILETPGLSLPFGEVQTNLVIFKVDSKKVTASHFLASLKEKGVLALSTGPQTVRICTHLDVGRKEIDAACAAISQTAKELEV